MLVDLEARMHSDLEQTFFAFSNKLVRNYRLQCTDKPVQVGYTEVEIHDDMISDTDLRGENVLQLQHHFCRTSGNERRAEAAGAC